MKLENPVLVVQLPIQFLSLVLIQGWLMVYGIGVNRPSLILASAELNFNSDAKSLELPLRGGWGRMRVTYMKEHKISHQIRVPFSSSVPSSVKLSYPDRRAKIWQWVRVSQAQGRVEWEKHLSLSLCSRRKRRKFNPPKIIWLNLTLFLSAGNWELGARLLPSFPKNSLWTCHFPFAIHSSPYFSQFPFSSYDKLIYSRSPCVFLWPPTLPLLLTIQRQ